MFNQAENFQAQESFRLKECVAKKEGARAFGVSRRLSVQRTGIKYPKVESESVCVCVKASVNI